MNQQIDELKGVKQSYLNEYFGVWAIHGERFDQLVNMAQGLDISKHLTQHENHSVIARSGEMGGNDRQPYEMNSGIAMISVAGPMMKHNSSMSANASTVLIRRQLSHAIANDQVKSILMLWDTPGGTVSGTQDLAAAIQQARQSKPGLRIRRGSLRVRWLLGRESVREDLRKLTNGSRWLNRHVLGDPRPEQDGRRKRHQGSRRQSRRI